MRKADILSYLLLGFVVLVPTYLLMNPEVASENAAWVWAVLPLAVIIAIAILLDNDESIITGLEPLKRFITRAMRKGHTVTEVQQALLSHGWPAHLVEQAFAAKGMLVQSYVPGAKVVIDDPYEPLREFIRGMEAHGASALIVRDTLIKAGWDAGIIDPIIVEMMKRKEQDSAVVQTILWFGKQNV